MTPTDADALIARLASSLTDDDIRALEAEAGRLAQQADRFRWLAQQAPRPAPIHQPAANGHAAPPRRKPGPRPGSPRPAGQTDYRAKRIDAVRHIAAHGPQRPPRLAEVLAVDKGTVIYRILEHPWFEKEPDGIHITALARREVLEPGRPAPADHEEDE